VYELTFRVRALQEVVAQPVQEFTQLPAGEGDLFRESCFRELLRYLQSSPAELDDALRALTPLIGVADLFQASRVAMLCGILVEWGGSPVIARDAILERLPRHLTLASRVMSAASKDGAELFSREPEAYRAWKGLRFMLLPAMTMLSRDVTGRLAARGDGRLLEALTPLEGAHTEAGFLFQLLSLSDGAEFIVLHPGDGKGYRVVTEGVGVNFHFFSLLQDALIGDPTRGMLSANRPSPSVVKAARGETMPQAGVFDSAAWHYAAWTALQADGSLNVIDLSTWIWGESRPSDIPEFEGRRVVLLSPPALGSRSWAGNFFPNLHEALRSRLHVEVLGPKVVRDWILRLRSMR
jgi:hypothetical protein